MKAVYINKFGSSDVLVYGERPKPIPKSDAVLIKVHAACVNPRDWLLREGIYFGRYVVGQFPVILGSDVSGVVESVGSKVQRFKVGDEVYAMQSHLGKMGGYAEYISVIESAVGIKPSNMTHEEAAAVPVAALTGWQALIKDAKIKKGDKVLIIGASGGVGTYGVQIAKAFGASVTGVCSTANVELVKSLGADRVIDYKKEKFNDLLTGYDIVYDTIGRESLKKCSSVLKPNGVYITTIPSANNALDSLTTKAKRKVFGRGQTSVMVLASPKGKYLAEIAKLSEAGKLKSVIDSVYALENTTDALDRSRTFRAKGKLILKVI